jgi:hypothetical protein
MLQYPGIMVGARRKREPNVTSASDGRVQANPRHEDSGAAPAANDSRAALGIVEEAQGAALIHNTVGCFADALRGEVADIRPSSVWWRTFLDHSIS